MTNTKKQNTGVDHKEMMNTQAKNYHELFLRYSGALVNFFHVFISFRIYNSFFFFFFYSDSHRTQYTICVCSNVMYVDIYVYVMINA